MDETKERRCFERVHLPTPLPGTIGTVRVFVIDLSLDGLQVIHQAQLPGIGASCTVRFEWEGKPVTLDCVRVRATVHRRPKSAHEKHVLGSGLRIEACDEASSAAIREMISHFVERALDERRANAYGIPASSALSYQTGGGHEYLTCELVGDKWRKTKSTRFDQPRNGFTVSVEEDDEQVEILCASYVAGDQENRALIRTFAALSVSKREGVPTRRYNP